MESWHNGREQLLEILSKACDSIGNNIDAEVNDENFVRISAEEHRILEQNATKAHELSDRIERLEDEKERYKAVASRVDALEAENKCLAAQLQQQLQTRSDVITTPGPHLAVQNSENRIPAPIDTISPDVQNNAADDDSVPVPRSTYRNLVTTYNTLCDNFRGMKSARQILADKLREEQDKTKAWNAYKVEQDAALAKKSEQVKKLKSELSTIKGHVWNGTATPTPGPSSAIQTPLGRLDVPASPKRPSAVIEEDIGQDEEIVWGEGEFDLLAEPTSNSELPPLPQQAGPVEDTQYDYLVTHHSSSTDDYFCSSSPKVTTETETPRLPMKRASSPSTPIVISSRSLKKSNRHRLGAATPSRKVKIETITSSPIGIARFASFVTNESLDLDDIGDKVDTPRKRRQGRETSKQLSQEPLDPLQFHGRDKENLIQGQVTKPGSVTKVKPTENTPIRRTDSVLQPRSTNKRILPRHSEQPTMKKRRMNTDEEVNTVLEDGELITPTRNSRPAATPSALLEQLLNKPSTPRQALDSSRLHAANHTSARLNRVVATSGLANEVLRISPHKPQPASRVPGMGRLVQDQDIRNTRDITADRSSRTSSNAAVADMFGSSRPSSRETSRTSVEPQRPKSMHSREVSAELRKSPKNSSRKNVDPVTPAVVEDYPNPTQLMSRDLMPPRLDLEAVFSPKLQPQNVQTPVPGPKPKQPAGSTVRRLRQKGMTLEDWEMDPEQEPLRSRPLDKLCLSDFRVRSGANNGYSYAFQQVVRGSARKELQGCLKECCKHKFRALAELATTDDPTPSQEEKDDDLLREFLGANAYKLCNMAKEERHEALLQARTRDLSNQHGRHRHAYTRPASPPGFWRADFPTTQEGEEDRAEAKAREKEMIAERYNEAMRPGGRFKFRDE